MKKIRIVIMGKTGVGKSTLINAIIGENKAKTGSGYAVTKENKVYTCRRLVDIRKSDNTYSKIGYDISLYDTVGLEVDRNITRETLQNIKTYISIAQKNSTTEDINIVWFCINEQANRFEPYEAELIKQLSIEYEIPFVIVLTQCFSKKPGMLAEEIQNKMPDIPIRRIMASDYEFDDNITIKAFGVDELLSLSINDFYRYRIKVIDTIIDEMSIQSDEKIKRIESAGKRCIAKYSEQAGKIGWLPGGCIPFVHGKCIKMISELNGIGGLINDEDFADEIFGDVVLGIIATPFMAVPLISKIVAEVYVENVGEGYLNAMLGIIRYSSLRELRDKKTMKERMKAQLKNMQ